MDVLEGVKPRHCQVGACERPPGDAIFPILFADNPPPVWLCGEHRAAYDAGDPDAEAAVYMIVHDEY